MKVLSKKVFEQEWGGSVGKTELVKVSVERGLNWERAMEIWTDHVGSDDGFYTLINVSEIHITGILYGESEDSSEYVLVLQFDHIVFCFPDKKLMVSTKLAINFWVHKVIFWRSTILCSFTGDQVR